MTNLVSLAEYKEYAGISSVEQDNKLNSILLYTSDFIKLYCRRSFIDNYVNGAFINIVDYWSGGHSSYYTKEFPVLEIVSVESSLDYGTTYNQLNPGVNYTYDMERERLYIPEAEQLSLVNAYKITYKGGFATTPPALKAAALDLVEYYMKKESTPRKTSGSVSIEYIRSSDLPYHIKRVLDLYRVID